MSGRKSREAEYLRHTRQPRTGTDREQLSHNRMEACRVIWLPTSAGHSLGKARRAPKGRFHMRMARKEENTCPGRGKWAVLQYWEG